MKETLKERTAEVVEGVKTLNFWLKGTLQSFIGGFSGSAYVYLNTLVLQGAGVDTGEMISWKAFFVSSLIGAGIKTFLFLKEFKIVHIK